jgi:hypothetical protein
MRCNKCSKYSHLACSRTTREILIKQQTMVEELQYTCIDCLILNKLPTYFIHHQVEHYLNIHNII